MTLPLTSTAPRATRVVWLCCGTYRRVTKLAARSQVAFGRSTAEPSYAELQQRNEDSHTDASKHLAACASWAGGSTHNCARGGQICSKFSSTHCMHIVCSHLLAVIALRVASAASPYSRRHAQPAIEPACIAQDRALGCRSNVVAAAACCAPSMRVHNVQHGTGPSNVGVEGLKL